MGSPLFEEEIEWTMADDGKTAIISRHAFCRDFFHYKKGEHVVFGGPSTRGKTTLAFDLLEYIATPDFPTYIAVSKPQDPVTRERGHQAGYRFVEDWPAPKKIAEYFGGEAPPGYVVWPHFGDLNTDMERCADVTARLLEDRYAHGASKKNKGGILMMDDTMVKAKIMKLDPQMVTILAMAGAMMLGLWIFVQKPTDSGRTTTWGYEMASHVFLTKAGDDRMLRRYMEIAGDMGDEVKRLLPTLDEYQFLYLHKIKGYVCIVDANPEK